jgi:LysM repeat protein
MAGYGLWLSYNDQKEGFELPILPSEITVTGKGDGTGQEVYGLGKINVIKSPALAEYAFEGIFPGQPYPSVTASIVFEPMWYVRNIEKWRASKRPIRLVYVGSNSYQNAQNRTVSEINSAVSIEQFDWSESAGESGDIKFSLKLKEYRFYAATKVTVVDQTGATTTVQKAESKRQNERQAPKTYTIVSGDSLWKVSQKIYGNPDRWKEIQVLNKLTDADLKRLKIGQVLKMPAESGGVLA